MVGRRARVALRVGRWLGVILVVAVGWQQVCNALELDGLLAVITGAAVGGLTVLGLSLVGWGLSEALESGVLGEEE